jgi:hypothetical protein
MLLDPLLYKPHDRHLNSIPRLTTTFTQSHLHSISFSRRRFLFTLIMTRTARSSFPRAVRKDRSESKSGLDKSLRKNGAGMHNWGSIADEKTLEFAALDDEELEFDDNESTSDSLSSQSECMSLPCNVHSPSSL